jgi:hypothetical protein
MACYSTEEIYDGCVANEKRMRARLDKTMWLCKIVLCITIEERMFSKCLASSMKVGIVTPDPEGDEEEEFTVAPPHKVATACVLAHSSMTKILSRVVPKEISCKMPALPGFCSLRFSKQSTIGP